MPVTRINDKLGVRRVPGGVLLLEWTDGPDATRVAVAIASLTEAEVVSSFCAMSAEWGELSETDRALRQLAVAQIFQFGSAREMCPTCNGTGRST